MSHSWKDLESFQLLYNQYYNSLVNFVHSRFVNNRDEAKDIVQSCFVKLWNNKDKIHIDSSIKNYLFQAARNTSLDYIKKYSSKTSNIDSVEIAEKLDKAEEVDYREYETVEIRTIIKQALAVLKPKTRKIFEMSKLEGLTYQEIADHLQISKRAVEDNMARAIVALKDEIIRLKKIENEW